jgi:hypothetical protein
VAQEAGRVARAFEHVDEPAHVVAELSGTVGGGQALGWLSRTPYWNRKNSSRSTPARKSNGRNARSRKAASLYRRVPQLGDRGSATARVNCRIPLPSAFMTNNVDRPDASV